MLKATVKPLHWKLHIDYFARYDKIHVAKSSFSSSLNMPIHLSSMHTFRGMSIQNFRLQLYLDLGYTSSPGLKRAHVIRFIDTDILGHIQHHRVLFTNNLMIQHSNMFIFPINSNLVKLNVSINAIFL